jgi:hypothetical protein
MIEPVHPCKLVCAILHHPDIPMDQLMAQLESQWGRVIQTSRSCEFSRGSQYYVQESGEVHHRFFVSFEGLVDPVQLAEFKLQAIELEAWCSKLCSVVARPVNLDPGLIMRGRLVLATTKDFAHRIYCQQGIYAEVTLTLHKREVRHLPWTYPDVKEGHYDDFFLSVHRDYLKESL